jgi:hypothetical protein
LAKSVPFSFILDYLLPLEPRVKSFFGCFGVYVGKKIVFILRNSKKQNNCNGLWLVTTNEHHQSLRKEFPGMHSVYLLNEGARETGWQMLSEDAQDFESSAIHACELVLRGDSRIGKVPKPKKRKPRRKIANGSRQSTINS